MPAPKPLNEADRLAALRDYEILDTDESRFRTPDLETQPGVYKISSV